ncbi:MAG: T9SS type A sorting domain-containing protein [Aequorivita antarctica]
MKTLLLFLAGIASLISFGQDGSLDTSFGDGGVVLTDLGNSQDYAYNVVQQTDGKIILSGNKRLINNDNYTILVRYLTDGSIDSSFGTDGVVTVDYGSGFYGYEFLFVDNQDKIVAAGNQEQGSNTVFIVARYLDSGQLDNSFGTDGIASILGGYNMMLLADGSFLLLRFTASNEVSISHYLNDGTLDNLFGVDGTAVSIFSGESFSIRETKVDGEGNIFLLGTRDNNANTDIFLMKFQPDGYLETNFGNSGVAVKNIDALNPMNFSSASLDFTNDNKIVIAGSCGACVDLFDPVMQPYFIRYLSDGSPDPNFGNNGIVLRPISGFLISQLMIQENQRMLVSGSYLDCFEGSFYVISRYFPGGTPDNSFNGASPIEFYNTKTISQEDGKIVTIGFTFWYNGEEDIVLLRHNNTTLAIADFENQKATIYPNPSNGIFTVECELFSETEKYQITDITGKIIALGELADKQTQINLSSAQSGVYFLKISNSVFRLLKN